MVDTAKESVAAAEFSVNAATALRVTVGTSLRESNGGECESRRCMRSLLFQSR